jgi:benzylsuccinate CoA-transferase BbsF subunit
VHDAFACTDEDGIGDRWIAVAAWTDEEAARLASITDEGTERAEWFGKRNRLDAAETLQAAGIEAVPVQDFGDLHSDPQLAHRRHFTPLTHPFLGDGLYERNGFRLSDASSGYDRAGPPLGQDQSWVLTDLLGLDLDDGALTPRLIKILPELAGSRSQASAGVYLETRDALSRHHICA